MTADQSVESIASMGQLGYGKQDSSGDLVGAAVVRMRFVAGTGLCTHDRGIEYMDQAIYGAEKGLRLRGLLGDEDSLGGRPPALSEDGVHRLSNRMCDLVPLPNAGTLKALKHKHQ